MAHEKVKARLSELGLELPVAALPVAAYVPAARDGKLIFTAGQLPTVDGKISKTGKVGLDLTVEEGYELAKICGLNVLAALALVCDLDEVKQILKTVGFVNSAPGFTGHPGVINGASELFIKVFGEAGRAARSSVGVAELPLNSPVEVEVVVSLK
ncbi:MAG: RidA family protein [Actinobacteria bacterium]|uniref:RidA family protein n=1 Tax=Candidatus Fonsibacter lacus TaxID=2576439 RepID=A0A965GDA5_9PROT|nr:RidA family protein [Candidatus Fonsibacter lacus]